MRTVMVAGDFGHFHAGHRDHIQKAAKLGDFLIIATHPDDGIVKRKGYTPDPLKMRMERLTEELTLTGKPGAVVLAVDDDGTVTKTLAMYHPYIFAKGAEYTEATLPKTEVEVCNRLGIKIMYGIGDRLGESRQIAGGR